MNIPLLGQLGLIVKLLFTNSKDLRETKRQDINMSLVVVGIIIFIAIIGLFLSLIFDEQYTPNWSMLWIPAIIVFIFVVIYIVATILIINRLLKDNNMKIDIPTCENRLCSLVNEVYPHARGYISRHFSILYENHEKFAQDISKIDGIRKVDLTEIETKDAANSVHGRFLCVLSDARYYPANDKIINTSQEAKELIDYFIRFEKHTRKNHITRIFTWNKTDTNCSKNIFLQYLLANDISGMDTYVLFSNETISTGLETTNSLKYFPYIDYVISDIINKDTHQRETKVYFSCEISESEPDKVIVSNDDFLLRLLETDFANRLDLIDGKKSQSHSTKLSQATFISILEDIGLISSNTNKSAYKNNINNIIDELSTFINTVSANTANSETKKKLISNLNSWHIK